MDLPMTRNGAQKLALWLKKNHGDTMDAALKDTPFSTDVACAIACQETGLYLVQFIDEMDAATALARCVFDASGDADGTRRMAFPRNTADFRAHYDTVASGFTEMLIAEANQARAVRGLAAKQWVYKGYGLFQYDLQHVIEDEAFFREKKWYDFGECLQRLVSELNAKFAVTKDRDQAIRAYNGGGAAAKAYLANVLQFIAFIQEPQA
jgi:hypothetical protein